MFEKKKYKVIRTDFEHLEGWLNGIYEDIDYMDYRLYKVLAEHSYDGALAVIILELNEV